MTNGMLSHCPMSSAMEFSNSTCGCLMNSMSILEPKITVQNNPKKKPGRLLTVSFL